MKNNDDLFNLDFDLSKFDASYIKVQCDTYDFMNFFHQIKTLPKLIQKEYNCEAQCEEEKEFREYEYETDSFMVSQFILNTPISLYVLIENTLKEYLCKLRNIEENSLIPHNVSRFNMPKIEDAFKNSSRSIELDTIASYEIIDEIRLLNNYLKHNDGIIKKDINDFWTSNNKITSVKVDESISRFSSGIIDFFKDLHSSIY